MRIALVWLCLLTACSATPNRACDGVTCTGHGQCVVSLSAPTQPLCACEAGFRALGLECVGEQGDGGLLVTCGPGTHAQADQCVADAAVCASTNCGAHGHCEAKQGGPACVCDTGYASTLQPGGSLVCRAMRCLGSSECAAGLVCSRASGQCETPVCGLSRAEAGPATLGGQCSPTLECGPGLVCVMLTTQTSFDGGVVAKNLGGQGVCATACDPCSPKCAASETCVASASGGFCSAGLAAAGSPCVAFSSGAKNPDVFTPCVGGSFCTTGLSRTGTCVVACGAPAGSSPAPFQPFLSADCEQGEVCQAIQIGLDGTFYACKAGTLAQLGHSCQGAANTCDPSLTCATGPIHTCGPPFTAGSDGGLVQCVGATCAAGVQCIQGACVADGAKAAGEYCFEARNCSGGLSCVRSTCAP